MPKTKTAKRKFARKFKKQGRKINLYNKIHAFKRTVASKNFSQVYTDVSAGSNINFSNSGMVTLSLSATQNTQYFAFGKAFVLSELPNYTEITQLFDSYKIIGIKFRIIPVNNTTSVDDTTNPANGMLGGFLHWIVDHDDNDAPTASDVGIDELRQNNSYKVHNLFNSYNKNGFVRYIRPKIPIASTYGALSGTIESKPQWLDCNSPIVDHFGLKGVFEIVNPSANVRYLNMKMEATYYLRAKDPR